MKLEKRSPLKERPLRYAGQSVHEKFSDILLDSVAQPIAIVLVFVYLAAMEWYRYFFPTHPTPLIYSGATVVAVLWAAWKIYRTVPKLHALRLGRDGEKLVGEFLDRLRADGYHVFHDVLGSGFNVDHVLIGPAGIFSVETKTFSKPVKGNAKVVFDGEALTVDGHKPDRDPVIQAKAQARWMRDLLKDYTGKTYSVRPVVVFPGWWVEQKGGHSTKEMWVLEPKALPAFLKNEPATMSEQDVRDANRELQKFIRSKERELEAS